MTDHWQEGTLELGDTVIHYHRSGGAGPSAVFAHGITDNGLCWAPVVQTLGERFDIVLYDARGHGLSSQPETGYAPREHAADLTGLIDGLGLERPVLVGHSMGAANAALVAAERPEGLRGLILEDPPWHAAAGGAPDISAWHDDIVRRQALTQAQLVAEGRAAHPRWREAELMPWAQAKLQVSPQVLTWTEARPTETWRELLTHITCPTLLICGDPERGAIVTEEVADEAAGLCNGLEVARLDAGHSVRRDQPDAYVALISTFLNQL